MPSSGVGDDALRQRTQHLYERDIFKPGQPRQCVGNIYWGAGHMGRYGEGDKGRLSLAKTRQKWLDESSKMLFDVASSSLEKNGEQFECFDQAFSTMLICEWRPKNAKLLDVVSRAHHLVVRLPSKSTPLPDDLMELPATCFADGKHNWQSLNIISRFSSNILRSVILEAYCLHEQQGRHDVAAIINSTSQLLGVCVQRSRSSTATAGKLAWLMIRAFLWNFWQQLRTFHQSLFVASEILNGFTHGNDGMLWLRDFSISEDLSLIEYTKGVSMTGKARNLCSWAFELVRSNHFCLGLDFSLLHRRWKYALGSQATRCSDSCDGAHPHHCLRYKGLNVEQQSMHDVSCPGDRPETMLVWDSKSYRAVQGARAVSVKHTDTNVGLLRYCAATDKTIAISHVWSHVQGGRPETGINYCLHQRYAEVARKFGCDSYWMDATCIPDEHSLRSEAISQINGVFDQSKGVLLCDVDLMTIDITEMTTEKHEAIICAILLCDWNLRAWTLLEGLKGRKNILVLCKDNNILSLSDTMRHVAQYGSLNILAFAYLLSPILPGSSIQKLKPDYRNSLSISTVGAWLSHRPASRPGDDLVIWSLLPTRNAKPIDNARELWKIQGYVHTGYLLSSAERLKDKGFSWAPKTPYAIPQLHKDGSVPRYHLPMLGEGTNWASIDDQGLAGLWLVHEFQPGSFLPKWGAKSVKEQSPTQLELRKVQAKMISIGLVKYGALLKPLANDDADDMDSVTAQGTLLAVCETNARTVRAHPRLKYWESYRWTWRGVYEWPASVPLPKFERDWWFWIN